MNPSEKVIFCTGDTSATYKFSDNSLEYDAIFDEPYATTIGEMYTRTTSIPYTEVTSIHYQTMSKKDTTWKIEDDFANKYEEFYNPSIKKVLTTINGMPHQLVAAELQVRDIYPELKKYFYKKNSNVTWGEFLTTKFGLWIDTRLSTDNTLHGSDREVEKKAHYFKLKKHIKSAMVILHATCLVLKTQSAT